MNAMTTSYTEDILKDGFEQRSISLRDDYEGKAVSVLVHRLAIMNKGQAVLYIHGFNDYFFQKEMAFRFNERGIHFYALDLRKYGRSWLPHQKFNDIRDLRTYFEEIEEAKSPTCEMNLFTLFKESFPIGRTASAALAPLVFFINLPAIPFCCEDVFA